MRYAISSSADTRWRRTWLRSGLGLIVMSMAVAPGAAIPPPDPGPPPQQMAAATDLWANRDIPADSFSFAMNVATYDLSADVLRAWKADRRRNYEKSLEWLGKRFRWRGESSGPTLKDNTVRCMIENMASFTVKQIGDLKQFIATESGQAFWDFYVVGRLNPNLAACVKRELSEIARPYFDADVREALKAR